VPRHQAPHFQPRLAGACDRPRQGHRIHVLCNHFKSQMGAADESA
jgi:hypothetical protein